MTLDFGWKRPCFGGLTFKNRGHWQASIIQYEIVYLDSWGYTGCNIPYPMYLDPRVGLMVLDPSPCHRIGLGKIRILRTHQRILREKSF